jgi:flagellar hook assembly protein FlgD
MKRWFKNFRIGILNWLAGGRLTINKFEKPQEYNVMSSYVLGSGGAGGQISINPNGSMGYGTSVPQNNQTLTIKITPANGGTIVTTQRDEYSGQHEFHVIPDGADFDRELGKIITMHKLKS